MAGRNVQTDHEIVVGVMEFVLIGSTEFDPTKIGLLSNFPTVYKSIPCCKDFFMLQRVAKRITKIGPIYGTIAIKLLTK